MRVLVVGSTGDLGSQVVSQLLAAGHEVRGLVRESSDPDVVEALRRGGATTVVGDLRDPESLQSACADVDAVISTASALTSEDPENNFDTVDVAGQQSLVDAAESAGVGRFVFVSVLGIRADSPFTEAKLAMEKRLRAASLDHTILQPTIFMDTWFSEHVGFDWSGGSVAIYGDGRAPLHWVASADVAAVAAAAVDDSSAANATIPVLGPEALSPADAVAIWERVTGSSIAQNTVPIEALEAQHAGAEHPTEKSFASLMLRYAAGDPAASTPPGIAVPRTTVADFAALAVRG